MPDPLFPGKLGLYASMVHYGLTNNRAFAREHYDFFCRFRDYVGGIEGKRILEVGCGKSYWLTLLMHSLGAQASGIDTENVEPGFSASRFWHILRANGPERALRTLIWSVVFARPYYKALEKVSGVKLNFDGVDVRGYEPHFGIVAADPEPRKTSKRSLS